jgi:hypothetical protein
MIITANKIILPFGADADTGAEMMRRLSALAFCTAN